VNWEAVGYSTAGWVTALAVVALHHFLVRVPDRAQGTRARAEKDYMVEGVLRELVESAESHGLDNVCKRCRTAAVTGRNVLNSYTGVKV
jgi:hypothetical protein